MSIAASPTSEPPPPGRGYTLPVWVAAAARAALAVLLGEPGPPQVMLQLGDNDSSAQALPVRACARLGGAWVLAETCCDPGEGLDLTRGLLIWVLARLEGRDPTADDHDHDRGHDRGPAWSLEAGEGVGIHADSGEICTSTYARELLQRNLADHIPSGQRLQLRLILPAGRRLAERTSNAAFGVVEGLALIGTQAETQASADPDQLQRTLENLRARLSAADFQGDLVLVIGENGLDLAPRLGLPASALLKCGNWLGPVLVAAAQGGARRLLLFGVEGKLIKLAGGIFHTHHHLADGRSAILTAQAALEGLSGEALHSLHQAPTVEKALAELQRRDPALTQRLRQRLAAAIEARSQDYLQRHGVETAGTGPQRLALGAALFDRSRTLTVCGPVGETLLASLRDPNRAQT
ncbi:MAG: cobalt-precorrin-5B (C(1))-methyltransferase CbiD [Cyanobium sp.]